MTYPVLSDLKAFLSVTGSTEDTLLTAINLAAINYAEKRTGRKFVAASAVRSFPTIPAYIDSTKKNLTTKGMDFVAVTSITNGDQVLLDADDYFLWPVGAVTDGRPYYRIMLHHDSGVFWTTSPSMSLIAVTASWGYSAACPAAMFEAILELGANMYRRRQTGAAGQVLQVGRGIIVQPGDLPQTISDVFLQFKRGGL